MNDDVELYYTGTVDTSSIIASIDTTLSAALVLVFLCRVARTWNQTGDKWAHLPDVSDWLVRQVIICIFLFCCTSPAYYITLPFEICCTLYISRQFLCFLGIVCLIIIITVITDLLGTNFIGAI